MAASVLNEKQKAFCREYVKDFNGTQAAIRSGYSKKTAREIASTMLTKVNIQSEIKKTIDKLATKAEITSERILLEYKRIAFGSVVSLFDDNGNLRDLKDLSEDEAATLSSLEIFEEYKMDGRKKVPTGQTKKIKVWDKLSALESLAKYMGIFEKDNQQKKQDVVMITLVDGEAKNALDQIRKIKK